MTQAEFDALPESGLFGSKTVELDGKRWRVPVLDGPVGAAFHAPDDPVSVIDGDGQAWKLERHDGVLHKRRMAR